MKIISFLLICIILLCFLPSCYNKVYNVVYPTLNDGKYDSEFPYKNCSEQLETITSSVKMINAMAFYEGYLFSDSSKIKLAEISDRNLLNFNFRKLGFSKTSSGSGLVFYFDNRKAALITCAHIVDFPDSIIAYQTEKKLYIKSISYKKSQMNFVNLVQGEELEVLKMDKKLDIAILGTKFSISSEDRVPVFSYPIGKAEELEWGSFVYLIGFPVGKKMITKAIVSLPENNGNKTFLLDALFNKGFSGGIILAVKDGVPNFELVGIAKSVSAHFEEVLIPDNNYENNKYESQIPYKDKIFVGSIANINYGVTNAISIESIIDFLEDNHKYFLEKDYNFEVFYK